MVTVSAAEPAFDAELLKAAVVLLLSVAEPLSEVELPSAAVVELLSVADAVSVTVFAHVLAVMVGESVAEAASLKLLT